MALENSAAREHVVFLYVMLAGLMATIFILSICMADLRNRATLIEVRDACRSRACLHSAHVEQCADDCVRALLP